MMKKSKKFLSIFAILFVAIFALSCCFFAACGSSEDDEKDDDDDKKTEDTTGDDGNNDEEKEEGDTQSGNGQTWTQVVYLATAEDVAYTTADVGDGQAVFTNNADLTIESKDGITYTVSGTASIMGKYEAAWYNTEDTKEGAPYVVIKIAVADGETIYFNNSGKSYTNDENGKTAFDGGYMFIVVKLTFEGQVYAGTNNTYTITDAKNGSTTYAVNFSGVTYPEEQGNVIASWDFTEESLFGARSLSYSSVDEITENTADVKSTTDTVSGDETEIYYIEESLMYLDGSDTGLTCLQSSEKITKVDGNTQRVNFGGGVKTYQSCLIYSLAAGTYTITMSYYIGTLGGTLSGNSVGRYATIIDGAGNDLCGEATDDCKTKETSAIEQRTVTIILGEKSDIYFGSASNGLYLTGITICS